MNTIPIFLSALVAFAATLSAGIFIKKFAGNIGAVCAFSAGFFIALSVFDLLPNILVSVPETGASLEQPLFIGLGGFFLMFALDRGFSRFQMKNHGMSESPLRQRIGLLSTLEFCSHGFIEGLAIGVSFELQFGLGVLVTIAVVSHDFCDGISTLALMLNSGNTMKASLSMLFVDAIAPVLGVAATLFYTIEDYFLVLMLAFLVGGFLYIGGGNLLPDAYRMNRPAVTVTFFTFAFFLAVLFAWIL